jgi:predicted phage terminase large subunit-like protein
MKPPVQATRQLTDREYLALLDERARREEARRLETERRRRAENAERIRQRCRTLSGFVREAWPILEPANPYIHGWHVDAICEHLEAITVGQITRLLINVPPGTMKSLLSGVFWPAWEWGPMGLPATRIIGSSYSEDYAKRDNRRMRDLVTSEWYQALWPTELVRAGEMAFSNTATGFRQGIPFSRLTGGRGDRVIIDDPHSVDGAESEADRNSTIRTFRESVPTRLNNPAKSAIVVIMQRLHEQDVSGTILSLGLGYEHLMLPMEFEPERRCVTSIGFKDPRSVEGELLFPERFPREVVERDKVPMGAYAVAGQFQQRPAPRTGGMFQRSDFEIVDALPAKVRRKVRAWDFAASEVKKGRQPDWTVGLAMSLADDVFYVEDVIRGRWKPSDVEKTLANTASQDGARVTIRIPEDPGAAGKADTATKIKLLKGYPVKAVRPTGDKATRARPASAQAEAGNIKLLRGPWNDAFLDEVCTFPSGMFDDQVDAFADALNELALGGPAYNIGALA